MLRCFMVKIINLNMEYILLPAIISINSCSLFMNLAILCDNNLTIFVMLSILSVNTFNLKKLGSLYYPILDVNASTKQISLNLISLYLGYSFWNSEFTTSYIQHLINEVQLNINSTKISNYSIFDTYLVSYFVLMKAFGGLFSDYGEGPSNKGGQGDLRQIKTLIKIP